MEPRLAYPPRMSTATDPPTIRLGLVQLACSENPRENLERALAEIEAAARDGADVVCLPELFSHRYFCQSEDAARFDLAEPIPGPTTELLAKVAAARKVSLVASIFERRGEGLYHNTAVVFAPDGTLAGIYRKMHIPDDPLYYEKFYFTPGDTGFVALETMHARIGPLVCWDQWFPEAARLTALAGAQILTCPSAIGWQFDLDSAEDEAQHDAWETVQRSHAIANGVFLAAVNRVGFEPTDPSGAGTGIRFWGQSFACDPMGRVLWRGSAAQAEIGIVECDLSLVERTRRDWPFLRDRRVDAYPKLLRLLDD